MLAAALLLVACEARRAPPREVAEPQWWWVPQCGEIKPAGVAVGHKVTPPALTHHVEPRWPARRAKPSCSGASRL